MEGFGGFDKLVNRQATLFNLMRQAKRLRTDALRRGDKRNVFYYTRQVSIIRAQMEENEITVRDIFGTDPTDFQARVERVAGLEEAA